MVRSHLVLHGPNKATYTTVTERRVKPMVITARRRLHLNRYASKSLELGRILGRVFRLAKYKDRHLPRSST